jgi:hypothetical protein
MISEVRVISPSLPSARRTRSLTVSLMAFSGATPTSCGSTPEYRPRKPSLRMTFLKQSIELLYSRCPGFALLWFCMRVLTRSMGYTMKAPNAPATLPSAKPYPDSRAWLKKRPDMVDCPGSSA